MKKLNSFLYLFFLLIIVCCSYQLIKRSEESKENSRQLTMLETLVEENNEVDTKGTTLDLLSLDKLEQDQERKKLFLSYQNLYEANHDYIGWVSIDGTQIEYPVLQNKETPEFYLYRNFEKKRSSYGSIYMDAACTINASNNYILYGHHMKDGSMFASITNYESEEYFKEHPTIRFDSLYEIGDYQIIAAFKVNAKELNELSSIISLNTTIQYDAFIDFINTHRSYDAGYESTYGDKFITLMTCDYTYKNGRFFVVAKKIT